MLTKKYIIEEFIKNGENIGDKVYHIDKLVYAKLFKTKIETQEDIDIIRQFLNYVETSI